MSKEATLIFPHQLFVEHPALKKGRNVWLIEDPLFFSQYAFHQQKLVLHRASMKYYQQFLTSKGFAVTYINTKNGETQHVLKAIHQENITEIHYADTADYLLERRLKRFSQSFHISRKPYATPNFLCTTEYLTEFFDSRKRYFLTEFYIEQRKRFNILVENQQPVGGKWTFDTENRKKLPAHVTIPTTFNIKSNAFVKEAIAYVHQNFQHHVGKVEDFNYPVTHEEAEACLDNFLAHRFTNYGIYQDAIIEDNSSLFHSLLTPVLNIGLLNPAAILEKAILAAAQNNVPLNSVEGFIRQILGWREFIRAVYIREGVNERTTNFFQHHGNIPTGFWTGETGIPPIGSTIKKLLKTGYNNHIERLMILGNFMALCEFHPDEVYHWFMTMYIDAYDWVMVPNVYGMSQFADGGLMATKPYISGSNYILKMSNYKKGPWCETWDALYWSFIDKHKVLFAANPRMSMMTMQLKKMDPARLQKLKLEATEFKGSML
ncbi:MAG: cryptochrome/photolyase family protein [Cyclobacteriaceae bacterium]|nr:cryptochrome/photolyase family protein [Cyclobacteriaceae bacterium]